MGPFQAFLRGGSSLAPGCLCFRLQHNALPFSPHLFALATCQGLQTSS